MPDKHLRTRAYKAVHEQCYLRDKRAKAKCWICGGDIDYCAKPGTSEAWEADHYLEVEDYPQYQLDPANIRPAHCRCNRKRGAEFARARARLRKLGEASRDWGI